MKIFIYLVFILLLSLLITYLSDIIKLFKPKESIVLNFKTWVCPISIYPNWYKVVNNGYNIKMSATGITLPSNKYSISFMYKLTNIHPNWTNVFHITNTATADGGFGGRNPSLWITPGDTKFHLRFCTNADNNNNGYDAFDNVPLKTLAFITFVFNPNSVSIYINGVNRTTNTFNGINSILPSATLYIANPNDQSGFIQLQDFTLYDGALTNDQIMTIYNESIARPYELNKWVFQNSVYPNWYKTVRNGYSIKMSNTGLSLPTNKFSISFMYKLTGTIGDWNNIVHITNSSGDDHRCPGIWVRPNETNLLVHYIPSDIQVISGVGLNTDAFFTFLFNYNNIELLLGIFAGFTTAGYNNNNNDNNNLQLQEFPKYCLKLQTKSILLSGIEKLAQLVRTLFDSVKLIPLLTPV
jgi:hypothetical protein